MRRILLLLSVVITSFSAIAQPTITGAACNPVAGETFYGRFCDTAGVSKGAAGAAVTWDFSTLNTTDYDTTAFIACTGTFYCDTFPGSTLTTIDSDYYITDTNRFAFNGYGSSSGSEYCPDPQDFLIYPMTFNSAKADTFITNQPGQSYSHGVDSFYGDAYGTLILPTGTFHNVLRIHMVNFETDSFTFVTPAVVLHTRSDLYFWCKPGIHYPLLTMSYDTFGTASLVPVLTDVEYFVFSAAGVGTVATNNTAINIFPNPANSDVHVRLSLANGGQVSITATDILGRSAGITRTENANAGVNDISYDVSSLPNGMYILKIQTPSGTELKKIQVAR